MSIPTRANIKARALELAAEKLGAGKITRVADSAIHQCEAAMRMAIDATLLRCIAQNRRGTKTLAGASVLEPILVSSRRGRA